jgi:hypothetical protein
MLLGDLHSRDSECLFLSLAQHLDLKRVPHTELGHVVGEGHTLRRPA